MPGIAARSRPYYRWRANPVIDAERVEAYRANALFDAHRADPEFGYRFLVEEARITGEPMVERTAWRICSAQGWWSAFGKKRGKNGKVGPPVHDDLVERDSRLAVIFLTLAAAAVRSVQRLLRYPGHVLPSRCHPGRKAVPRMP